MLRLPLLILDEPIDGLDFEATEYLYEAVVDYKKYGAVFMSSHVAESFQRCCDVVDVLNRGGLSGPFPMDSTVNVPELAGLE